MLWNLVLQMSLTSELDKRITILRPPNPEIELDEAGQPLDSWQPVTNVWASIETLNGRQLESARQIHAEITTRIKTRYRTGIDRTMKAVYRGAEFEFLYVTHKDYAKKELIIMAKELQ